MSYETVHFSIRIQAHFSIKFYSQSVSACRGGLYMKAVEVNKHLSSSVDTSFAVAVHEVKHPRTVFIYGVCNRPGCVSLSPVSSPHVR